MDEKGYKATTHEKFRKILKLFFKDIYGNNQFYPDKINWFSSRMGKEKQIEQKYLDIEEYLEEEEIKKLIDIAPTIQKKAFLSCMYKSGARPEEFLRLLSYDLQFDSKGAILILRGKTGERRVRILSFVKLLQQWIEIHPLKASHQSYPLWLSEATNSKNKPFGLRGAERMIEQLPPKAVLANKHARLFIYESL